jgi:hypothetical protein
MTDATQQGAEVSVEDRIAGILDAQETPETPQEATNEDLAEETNDDEAEEAESDGPDSKEEGEEVTDDEDAVEEIELDASQLAEYLGIDADAIDTDEDGNLYLKTKIDGKPGKATLSELIKSYQLEGHVNQKSMQLAEERKSFEAESQAAKQALQQTIQQAQNLLQMQEQNLLGEYNSVDWNSLKQQDPGLYAAARQEMSERYNEIQRAKQYTSQQGNQLTQEQRQQFLYKESQALEAALPAWGDREVQQKEKSEVASYLTNQGFSPEEVQTVGDHRAVLIARKAMLYDKLIAEQSTQTEIAKKKVIKKPKVLKPGASKSSGQAKAEAQKQKLKMVKQSGGSVDSIASLLIDRM